MLPRPQSSSEQHLNPENQNSISSPPGFTSQYTNERHERQSQLSSASLRTNVPYNESSRQAQISQQVPGLRSPTPIQKQTSGYGLVTTPNSASPQQTSGHTSTKPHHSHGHPHHDSHPLPPHKPRKDKDTKQLQSDILERRQATQELVYLKPKKDSNSMPLKPSSSSNSLSDVRTPSFESNTTPISSGPLSYSQGNQFTPNANGLGHSNAHTPAQSASPVNAVLHGQTPPVYNPTSPHNPSVFESFETTDPSARNRRRTGLSPNCDDFRARSLSRGRTQELPIPSSSSSGTLGMNMNSSMSKAIGLNSVGLGMSTMSMGMGMTMGMNLLGDHSVAQSSISPLESESDTGLDLMTSRLNQSTSSVSTTTNGNSSPDFTSSFSTNLNDFSSFSLIGNVPAPDSTVTVNADKILGGGSTRVDDRDRNLIKLMTPVSKSLTGGPSVTKPTNTKLTETVTNNAGIVSVLLDSKNDCNAVAEECDMGIESVPQTSKALKTFSELSSHLHPKDDVDSRGNNAVQIDYPSPSQSRFSVADPPDIIDRGSLSSDFTSFGNGLSNSQRMTMAMPNATLSEHGVFYNKPRGDRNELAHTHTHALGQNRSPVGISYAASHAPLRALHEQHENRGDMSDTSASITESLNGAANEPELESLPDRSGLESNDIGKKTCNDDSGFEFGSIHPTHRGTSRSMRDRVPSVTSVTSIASAPMRGISNNFTPTAGFSNAGELAIGEDKDVVGSAHINLRDGGEKGEKSEGCVVSPPTSLSRRRCGSSSSFHAPEQAKSTEKSKIKSIIKSNANFYGYSHSMAPTNDVASDFIGHDDMDGKERKEHFENENDNHCSGDDGHSENEYEVKNKDSNENKTDHQDEDKHENRLSFVPNGAPTSHLTSSSAIDYHRSVMVTASACADDFDTSRATISIALNGDLEQSASEAPTADIDMDNDDSEIENDQEKHTIASPEPRNTSTRSITGFLPSSSRTYSIPSTSALPPLPRSHQIHSSSQTQQSQFQSQLAQSALLPSPVNARSDSTYSDEGQNSLNASSSLLSSPTSNTTFMGNSASKSAADLRLQVQNQTQAPVQSQIQSGQSSGMDYYGLDGQFDASMIDSNGVFHPSFLPRPVGTKHSRLSFAESPSVVLVIKKHKNDDVSRDMLHLCDHLANRGVTVYAEPNVVENDPLFAHLTPYDTTYPGKNVDFAVTLGGDGTVLHYNSLFNNNPESPIPPVVSFALGSLGFLTPFPFKKYKEIIDVILKAHINPVYVCPRMRLLCKVQQAAQCQLQNTKHNVEKKETRMAAAASRSSSTQSSMHHSTYNSPSVFSPTLGAETALSNVLREPSTSASISHLTSTPLSSSSASASISQNAEPHLGSRSVAVTDLKHSHSSREIPREGLGNTNVDNTSAFASVGSQSHFADTSSTQIPLDFSDSVASIGDSMIARGPNSTAASIAGHSLGNNVRFAKHEADLNQRSLLAEKLGGKPSSSSNSISNTTSTHVPRYNITEPIHDLRGPDDPCEDDEENNYVASYQALNECIVQRGLVPSIAWLQLYIDGYLITTVRADGLIVSTPTGSTGYSMSAGGPMMAPSTPAITITPVCPHNLSFRPVVVCDSTLLRLMVHPDMDGEHPLHVSFDGRSSHELYPGDSVQISMSPVRIPSIVFSEFNTEWFKSIKHKLHWNASLINKL